MNIYQTISFLLKTVNIATFNITIMLATMTRDTSKLTPGKTGEENKFVRFWRKLYVYTDPAAEDYSFYHHNIDAAPKYSDL